MNIITTTNTRRRNYLIFFCLIMMAAFLCPTNLNAQDGWELIKKNDNVAAKKAFLEVLKNDSTDINALYGSIYIAELEQNDLAYEKYVNTLLNNHPDASNYLLFKNHFNGDIQKLKLISDSFHKASTYLAVQKADDLFTNRKFAESKKAYADIIGNYDWSVIGPFKNVSGYGFIKEYEVEKDKFDSSKTYNNGYDLNFGWVNRRIRNNDGVVIFSDNLANDYSNSVFFANTFLTVHETVQAQFRIARNTPMKIWLDGCLVFQNNDNAKFSWDDDIVNITLTKGTHRLLIKCATLPNETDNSSFLSYNDGGYNSSFKFDFSNFMDFSSFYGGSSYDDQFALRITDQNGKLIQGIQSSFSGDYTAATYETKNVENGLVNYFTKAAAKDPEKLINYYLLCKAAIQAGKTIASEETFVKLLRKNSDMVFFKYLAAKIYATNEKTEKAYLILNDIDEAKTPVFALMYEDLNKLDKDADEKEYVKMLMHLDTIFPSSMSVIEDVITYYQKKGMNDEKKKYVKAKMELYPSYKEDLEDYLEDDNYKPNDYKPETDKERKKEAKEAINNLKTKFNEWDYETAITHYKNIEKKDKVISLYNELISIEPFIVSHLADKADYYYTKEMYDDAISVLNAALTMSPYSTSVMETLGDIYSDKKEKEKAIGYYQKVLSMKVSDYGREDIEEKIEKLQEKDNIKDFFVTKTFDDILKEDGWKDKYKEEKSVILLYTKDVCLDSLKTTHMYQKLMIKILTEDGARLWTQSDFSYLGDLSFVKVIKKNGAVITPDNQYGYVVFKDLEPGDIIQMEGNYSGSMDSEFDGFFMLNYLSYEAPVYYCKVEVIMPESTVYNYDIHKLKDNVVKKKEKGYDYYRWEFTDIAKVEEEDDVFDRIDPYAYIWGTSMTKWSQFVDWYQQKTYRKLEPTYEVLEVLDTIIKPTMTTLEKVEAVYNFVAVKINYSSVSFLQSNFIPKRPGLTCSAGIGDCKDVATLMITMLHELGIESYYVLVKTNKFFHNYIMPSMLFDHVIVAYVIDGKTYYADPTSNYYPYYCLSENDANAHALLIKDGENNIFRLHDFYTDTLTNKQLINITAEIKEDKSVTVDVDVTSNGIEAGYLRETINPMTQEEQKKFIPEYFGEQVFENLKIESFDFGDLKEISKPLNSKFKLSADNYTDKVTSMLIFRIPFVKCVLSNTSVKKEKRYSDIDLAKILDITPSVQTIKIKFPAGYKLAESPENVIIDNKFGKYELTFKKTTDGLEVTKKQFFKSRVVALEDFDAFKAFYQKIQDADETKLSIKK